MLLAEPIPPEVANYWAPVAQIVPVFALALVIEARGLASRWRVDGNPRGRRLEALFIGLGGFALFMIEGEALGHLANGTTSELSVQASRWALLFAISAIAWNPVAAVMAAGFTDSFLLALKRMPGSTYRASLKDLDDIEAQVMAEIEDDLKRLDVAIEDGKTIRSQQRELANMRKIAQLAVALPRPGIGDADKLEMINLYLLMGRREVEFEQVRKIQKRIRKNCLKTLGKWNELLDRVEAQRDRVRLDVITPEEMKLLQGAIERYRVEAPIP